MFVTSEHMYKKRINAWGLSKHVKADEKETAITNLLHNELPVATSGSAPIRHDKLVRYAKSRAKSGALDTRYLSTIVDISQGHGSIHKQYRLQSHPIRHRFHPNTQTPITEFSFLPRSPAPPIDHANFDLFLRAMTRLIEQERHEWLTGQQRSPSLIFDSLTTGLAHWRKGAVTAACQSFNHAAQTMTEDLRGITTVSRIAYCISSIVWGFVSEPVFFDFVRFMSNSSLEILGPDSPLTIILDQLSNMWSLDAQVLIWACAVDNYPISKENIDHWWNMVRRRWCWCMKSELMDHAIRYRDHALNEARQMKLLTDTMEFEAQHDLPRSEEREDSGKPHAVV